MSTHPESLETIKAQHAAAVATEKEAEAVLAKATEKAAKAGETLTATRAACESKLAGVEEGFCQLERLIRRDTSGAKIRDIESLICQATEAETLAKGGTTQDAKSQAGRVPGMTKAIADEVAKAGKCRAGEMAGAVKWEAVALAAGKSRLPGSSILATFADFIAAKVEKDKSDKALDRAAKSYREAVANSAKTGLAVAAAEKVAAAPAETPAAPAETETPVSVKRRKVAA